MPRAQVFVDTKFQNKIRLIRTYIIINDKMSVAVHNVSLGSSDVFTSTKGVLV